jgi:hypothetical protein
MPTPPLTHDERQAAESAYRGAPLNPLWTQRAQTIYAKIWAIKHGQAVPSSRPEPSTITHHREASPLLPKPVQAWHVHYTDQPEDVVILFPIHAKLAFLLSVVQHLSPNRPFEMQPLKQGHFPISWPDPPTIAQLYAQDARTVDHLGHVHLRSLPPKPPAA